MWLVRIFFLYNLERSMERGIGDKISLEVVQKNSILLCLMAFPDNKGRLTELWLTLSSCAMNNPWQIFLQLLQVSGSCRQIPPYFFYPWFILGSKTCQSCWSSYFRYGYIAHSLLRYVLIVLFIL